MPAMPAAIRFWHARIVEARFKPFVCFDMTIRKSKHSSLAMLVAGDVVNIVAIHVHAKLRTTNAVRMKFAENKYVSGSPH